MKPSLVRLGVILIGSLIFLISCSGEGKWIKPGSGESELDKDYRECRSLASQECGYTEWPGYFVQKNCIKNFTENCLYQRGWKYQKP